MALSKEEKQLLKKLGLKIRYLREKNGWTLEETEEQGWRSWKHLQRIEAGTKNINFTTLVRLAKLFNIKLKMLIEDL